MKGKYGLFWGCSAFRDGCKARYKNKSNKPVIEQKKEFVTNDCPVDECGGEARQYQKKDKSSYFWICNECASNGRNKFLNDLDGLPQAQVKKS